MSIFICPSPSFQTNGTGTPACNIFTGGWGNRNKSFCPTMACDRTCLLRTGAVGVNPTLWVEEATPPLPCWACSGRNPSIKGSNSAQLGLTTEEGGCRLSSLAWELLNLQLAEAKPAETQADTRTMEDTPERTEPPGTAPAEESRNPGDAWTAV